jgi:RNA polymerase sigma factor (sigma-70 family)
MGVPFAEWSDCTQEFVLRCLLRLRQRGELCENPAYLHRAARNHIYNYLRDTARWRNTLTGGEIGERSIPNEPLLALLRAEMQSELERLLRELPERRRVLWQAHYLEGESIAGLAVRFEQSENAVRLALSRTNRQLRTLLEKNILADVT